MRSRSPGAGSRCCSRGGLLSLGPRSDAGGSYKRLPTHDHPGLIAGGYSPHGRQVAEHEAPQYTSVADSYFQRDEEERGHRVEPTPHCDGPEILESWPVQGVTIFMILANALIIGFETDMPDLCHWDAVENGFLAVFTAELALRVYLHGLRGYCQLRNNPDITWNIFDLCIVTTGIVNLFAAAITGNRHSTGNNPAIFRIVRLLRILRVLRMIRIVRFLKQLYLLAYGFLEGTMAVFWVTLLASGILYICSVILVRTYGRADAHEGMDEEEAEFFDAHFGTIPRTMFSLFELISAPDLVNYRTTMFRNPPLVLFLVTFIILGSFGINGLLVALINESILEKNQARLEADRMDRESKRKLMQRRCQELFDSLDVNKNRVLPRNELIACTAQLAGIFESVGVNFQRKDLDQMFYIMDCNDTGIIERSEFVAGVLELSDQIRPMSIMELHYQVSKCVNKVEQTDAKVEAVVKACEQHDLRLDRLQRAVDRQRRVPAIEGLSPRSRSPPRRAPEAPEAPPAELGGLRRALQDLGRGWVEVHMRVEGLLRDSQQLPEQQSSPDSLRSLSECLLSLEESNLETLGALLGYAWRPGRPTGAAAAEGGGAPSARPPVAEGTGTAAESAGAAAKGADAAAEDAGRAAEGADTAAGAAPGSPGGAPGGAPGSAPGSAGPRSRPPGGGAEPRGTPAVALSPPSSSWSC